MKASLPKCLEKTKIHFFNMTTDEKLDLILSRLKPEEVIVSCTEAARLLGRTRKTISEMLRDGRLKKTARGQSVGILLEDIKEIQRASR